ncbi:hypothetical protein HK100_002800 [Physocladia obscura]|uniref:Uncharacterized protein n=1 Tax=Physocladia obscura TaxID=109957 RepID=A0AAD5SVA8_9FUNG|nr:hypothetical protein HK100_002800 [Physocladia obscura]
MSFERFPSTVVITSSQSVTDTAAPAARASFRTESSSFSATAHTLMDTTTVAAVTTVSKTITARIITSKSSSSSSSSSSLITATSRTAHSLTGISSPTSSATIVATIPAANSSNSIAGQLSNGVIGAIAVGTTLTAAIIIFVAWICVIRYINHRKHAVGTEKIEARGEEIALDSRSAGGGGGRKSYAFKGMGEMYAQTMRAGFERVITVTRQMTGSTNSGGGGGVGENLGTGGKSDSTRSKEVSQSGSSFAYVVLEDSTITSPVGGW